MGVNPVEVRVLSAAHRETYSKFHVTFKFLVFENNNRFPLILVSWLSGLKRRSWLTDSSARGESPEVEPP